MDSAIKMALGLVPLSTAIESSAKKRKSARSSQRQL